MAKKFKKCQLVVATLPNGRVVEGTYSEPWGEDGHSICVNEYNGERGGKPIFKKVMYGVKDDCIDAVNVKPQKVSMEQYKAWLKRAIALEDRIKENKKSIEALTANSKDRERLKKKIERGQCKLDQINAKIKEFEDEED